MSIEKPSAGAKAVLEDRLATEYLANERTFLAWIRTSVSIISLGFVIAKFRIWMQEMGPNPPVHLAPGRMRESSLVGIGMVSLGALIAILAAWRYHVVNRQIEAGKVTADRGLIILVTVLVAGLAAAMIATIW
jgi:inner membrane protein YidH